ncbi:MAG TPA: ABC transporter substrate-binding protein [Treponema sp.]|jgi:iron(III) transport system substrate-binding protein|nr:ABC transporter substrate-binding protein [Treponema sp.]HBB43617.1 ABC transporter substrate-binding protein [Treponema sp.]HCA20005.1 ABC transporter substrate-binding protein [Treponema sp.]
MKQSSKRIALLLSTLIATLSLISCGSKQELHVYSIIHDEETKALTDLFTKKTGIPVSYIRATTGELVSRVIAEKDNPQADILLGGATAYHMQADDAGALEKYTSPAAANVPSYAVSENGTWTGFCVLTLGIGVNSTRFAEKFPGKALPATWDDLIDADYRGEIVLTDPAASSTAYLFVQDQLQRLGWDEGWAYLLSLSELVGQFPDSGSAPPKLIGTGEYAIGIAYLHALAKYKAEGFDIKLIAPPQSVGDVDCISILKNTKNPEAARKFVDFMLSAEAQELMSSLDFTIPVNPDAKAAEGSIPIAQIDLIDYDAQKASEQKDEVLSRWTKEVK